MQYQGLPHDTLNYGVLVTAGWKTLNAHCDLIRLFVFMPNLNGSLLLFTTKICYLDFLTFSFIPRNNLLGSLMNLFKPVKDMVYIMCYKEQL